MSELQTKYLDFIGLQQFWGRLKIYIDNQDAKLLDQLKSLNTNIKNLIDSKMADVPIVKGDVDNSAVLKGEYQGYSNKAISQVSTSIGAATTAGLKGYYYKAIDFISKKIYLSASQPNSIATSGFSAESITCDYSVGDYISIVADSKFENCSKITAKDSGVITVDSLPFSSIDLPSYTLGIGKQPDDFTLYSANRSISSLTNIMTVKNYDKGLIDFGGGALAEGVQTFATNIGAHAEGIQTHAYGQYSHTEGFRTQAGYTSHAEGRETTASGSRSHAEGDSTTASGDMSHAEGRSTNAIGKYSHTEGYLSSTEANASHAEGYSTTASGDSSHAEGWKSIAKGKRSHAEGSETYAEGYYSHTEGLGTKTTNEAEHASGKYNVSTEGSTIFSVGIGESDDDRKNAFEITSDGDVYIGGINEENKVATLQDIPVVDTTLNKNSNNPIANSAVANAISGGVHFIGITSQLPWEGFQNTTIGRSLNGSDTQEYSVGDIIIVSTGGDEQGINEPTTEYILAWGNEYDPDDDGIITGYRWVELGDISPAQEMIDASTLFTTGYALGSVIAKDRGCIANGQYSTVIGRNGRAYGNYSYVEGRGQGDPSSILKDEAANTWDDAESDGANRLHLGVGDYVHVEGLNNIAIGNYSHVEGQRNKAEGPGSHAEGWKTQAIGNRSHAEGQSTIANGNESHAGGVGSVATGARSFVHGNYVNTSNNDEVAFGKYNKSTSSTLFSVGNGEDIGNRKNAFEITSDAGYIHSNKIASEDFVNDNFIMNTGENLVGDMDESFSIIHHHNPFTHLTMNPENIQISSVDDPAHPYSFLSLSVDDDSFQQAILGVGDNYVKINEENIKINCPSTNIGETEISQKNGGYEYKFICTNFDGEGAAYYDRVEAIFNGELVFNTDYWDFNAEKVPLMGFEITSYNRADADNGAEDTDLRIGQIIYIALDENWKNNNSCGVTYIYMQPYDGMEQYGGSEYSTVTREYKENPYQGGVSTSMLKLDNVEIKSSDQQLVLNIGSISGRIYNVSEDIDALYVKAIYTGEDILYKTWINEGSLLDEPIIDYSKGKAMKFEIFESECGEYDDVTGEYPFAIGRYLYVKINSWTSENYTTDFNTYLYWENFDDIGGITNISNYVIYKSNEQIDGSGVYVDSNILINNVPVATIDDIQTFNHIKEHNGKVNIDIPVYSTEFFENGTSLINKYAQKSLVTQLSNTITNLQNTINYLTQRIEALEGSCISYDCDVDCDSGDCDSWDSGECCTDDVMCIEDWNGDDIECDVERPCSEEDSPGSDWDSGM